MIIVMKPGASEPEIDMVVERIGSYGLTANIISGSSRTVIGITGNSGTIDPGKFENLPGVAEVVRITKALKLAVDTASKERKPVPIGTGVIGDGSLAIIAGPCAVESEKQLFESAEAVAASGAQFFRGGAFKPRTSPYAFQGMGEDGLKLLRKVRESFGLNIVTEAMDERGVDLVAKYGDCIQIGARNMQNFSLLRYAGRSGKPILLKRGLSATLDELLLSAEYILAEGNKNVVLCERGIRTFADHARNTLDLSVVPAVQRLSQLPIIVDPSHGTGRNYLVGPMACAAVAAGSDGLIIEVHACPEEALCDGAQALTPLQYRALQAQLFAVHDALRPRGSFASNTGE